MTPSKPAKILPVNWYLLPHQYEWTPKENEQLVHMQAGLGRKTMHMDESASYDEVWAFNLWFIYLFLLCAAYLTKLPLP